MKLFKIVFLSWIFISAILPLQSQTIVLTYDANGNRITKQFNSSLPVPVLSGDSLICHGQIGQINVAGGSSYLWSTGATQNQLSVLPDTTTQYWVRVTNSQGCSDTATWLLKVISTPATDTINGMSVVNMNQIASYTVPNHPGSFYNWTITNGIIISGYGMDSIVVDWDGTDTIGSVSVYESVNGGDCNGNTSTENVNVLSTGIKPVGLSYFSMFPNPTDGNVAIQLGALQPTPLLITITNVLGEVTGQMDIQTQQSTFNINLKRSYFGAAGIYNISIQTNSTTITKTEVLTK